MGARGDTRLSVSCLAASQHGVVTRRQLVRLGVTARQVEGWVMRGELRRLHRGVYLMGPVATRYTPFMAGVLACGAEAALSHRSGVHLYELLPHPARPRPIHISVVGHHVAGERGLVVHRVCRLANYEVRNRDGIPVTAPIRTLIDFAAGDATDEELERAVAEAFALRLTQRGPLLREVERHRGKRGIRRLRLLLDGDGPMRTRSRPERALLAGLRAAGIGGFETNARLGRWEVDFYWPVQGLVVEVDAYSTHSSPWAFERDRRKSADLSAMGLLVHRVTRRRIDSDPAGVLNEIIALLRRLSSRPP
jgi:very-short-patch-repair endonuclease/predicted transcriptional regulator of viral defense system